MPGWAREHGRRLPRRTLPPLPCAASHVQGSVDVLFGIVLAGGDNEMVVMLGEILKSILRYTNLQRM